MTSTATATTAAQNARAYDQLPFDDRRDYDAVARGFIAPLADPVVRAADGRIVWNLSDYDFLSGDCPNTVHPSLWRQSQLLAHSGLYEVVDGIYQVRGLDLSVITFLESDTGVIVVDPLISVECAAAALELYRTHRGERPVVGVVFSHSHIDHFGGVRGVTTVEDVAAGRCRIVAPDGFLEHAVAENVYAGPAMARRAAYMYGAALPRGPLGQVSAGLGQTTSLGTPSLIAPTDVVTRTGEELVIDGLRFVFQMAPGTEAPSEFHFHLPAKRAVCLAENATHTLHNILTLRGAVVRDAHDWARYLTEALDLFVENSDVAFAPHHWPTWGRDEIADYLAVQRDIYAYLHDQTLRMMNDGLVGAEIAEAMVLPPALERAWHVRGYYGSVSHNVKAIYQRYMGWYDGNPAHLWQHPPVEAGQRYVRLAGGLEPLLAQARESYDAGDYRWVAEVVSHAVFAHPESRDARELLADALEQLGFASENGTWRCAYLTGAQELRHGVVGTPVSPMSPDLFAALSTEQILDAIAIRVDGPAASDLNLVIDVALTDTGVTHRVRLRNGVLTHSTRDQRGQAALTVRAPAAALALLLAPDVDPSAVPGLSLDGDGAVLGQLMSVLANPAPAFGVVTP